MKYLIKQRFIRYFYKIQRVQSWSCDLYHVQRPPQSNIWQVFFFKVRLFPSLFHHEDIEVITAFPPPYRESQPWRGSQSRGRRSTSRGGGGEGGQAQTGLRTPSSAAPAPPAPLTPGSSRTAVAPPSSSSPCHQPTTRPSACLWGLRSPWGPWRSPTSSRPRPAATWSRACPTSAAARPAPGRSGPGGTWTRTKLPFLLPEPHTQITTLDWRVCCFFSPKGVYFVLFLTLRCHFKCCFSYKFTFGCRCFFIYIYTNMYKRTGTVFLSRLSYCTSDFQGCTNVTTVKGF